MKKRELIQANLNMLYLISNEIAADNPNFLPLYDIHKIMLYNLAYLNRKRKKKN